MTFKRTICLAFCLGAGVCFGAYQYIISGYPAANPSETAQSAAVSVNAQTSGNALLATQLETRYRTSTGSNTNVTVFHREKPGIIMLIR